MAGVSTDPEIRAASSTVLPSTVLEADAVSYAYGSEVAVEDVSFTLRAGEFAALAGPNTQEMDGKLMEKLANIILRLNVGAISLPNREEMRSMRAKKPFSSTKRIGFLQAP
jgi:ABC-type branched-subunit amino acid transport system ATPase component